MAILAIYFLQNMLDPTRIFKVQTDFQERLCTIVVGVDELNRRLPTPLKGWSELDHLIHKKYFKCHKTYQQAEETALVRTELLTTENLLCRLSRRLHRSTRGPKLDRYFLIIPAYQKDRGFESRLLLRFFSFYPLRMMYLGRNCRITVFP